MMSVYILSSGWCFYLLFPMVSYRNPCRNNQSTEVRGHWLRHMRNSCPEKWQLCRKAWASTICPQKLTMQSVIRDSGCWFPASVCSVSPPPAGKCFPTITSLHGLLDPLAHTMQAGKSKWKKWHGERHEEVRGAKLGRVRPGGDARTPDCSRSIHRWRAQRITPQSWWLNTVLALPVSLAKVLRNLIYFECLL